MTDVVEAGRFSNRVEADLARLYLESEGVVGVLFDADINNVLALLRNHLPDDDWQATHLPNDPPSDADRETLWTNITGSKRFARLIRSGDFEGGLTVAREQVEASERCLTTLAAGRQKR